MDRRWISTIFWTCLFGMGVYFSSRISPSHKTNPLGDLFRLYSVNEVQQQTHYTQEEMAKKSEATPEPSQTPDESLKSEELLAMLREDRLCDFVETPHPRALLMQVLLENAQSPLLNQLFGPNGPMNGSTNFDVRDDIGLFYNALLHAGLLEGVKLDANDYSYSEKLFRELEIRDPDNGAFFYFHAHVAALAGRSLKDQRELILRAIQSLKFNTYLSQVMAEFKASGNLNATSWLATVEALSGIPIPSYPKPEFVRKLLSRDSRQVHEHAVTFGLVMMEHPTAIKIEKFFGMHLVGDSWNKAYPREKIPNLKKKIEAKKDLRKEKLFEKARSALNADDCDRRLMDTYFNRFRDDAYPI